MGANQNLVQSIFDRFLATVEADLEIDAAITPALRKVILESDDLSVKGVTEALFGEEQLP